MKILKNKKNRRIVFNIIVQIMLISLSIIYLFPFFWMLSSALKTPEEMMLSVNFFSSLIPKKPQWRNFIQVFHEISFGRYFFNTAFVTVLSVIGTVFSSALVAYAFSKLRWPGRDVLFMIVMATMMLPSQIILIPSFIMYSTLNLTDTYIPMILPAYLGGGAFNIFLLKQFYHSIPNALAEAARIDGGNEFGIWSRIMLPLCKPVLATVAIFAFMLSWNDFMGPLIYITTPKKNTLALGLRAFQQQSDTRWDMLMSGSIISMLPVLILFFCFQKYFISGIKVGGVKG